MLIYKFETFKDDRGVLVFTDIPKVDDTEWKYLTMGSLKPHTERGGHYHKKTLELLLCLSGRLRFKVGNEEIILEEGDAAYIPTGSIHTIYNDWDTLSSFVEFKSRPFIKGDNDVYKD